MTIDAYFDAVAVLDVQLRIDCEVGETFSLVLNGYDGEEVFSNQDQVLAIHQVGPEIAITTTEKGLSRLLIMKDTQIVRTMQISVVDEVSLPAVSLGLSFGEPEMK